MMSDNKKTLGEQLEAVREEVKVLGIRLTLAQAWLDFLNYAYDALLNWGINYKSLPEYKDDEALDEAHKLPISRGRDVVLHWLQRARTGVSAAIRRKQLKVHVNEDHKTIH